MWIAHLARQAWDFPVDRWR